MPTYTQCGICIRIYADINFIKCKLVNADVFVTASKGLFCIFWLRRWWLFVVLHFCFYLNVEQFVPQINYIWWISPRNLKFQYTYVHTDTLSRWWIEFWASWLLLKSIIFNSSSWHLLINLYLLCWLEFFLNFESIFKIFSIYNTLVSPSKRFQSLEFKIKHHDNMK